MPAKLGTNYGTGITRCAVWNRSIISSTNSLETGNSTLIKFPIQHPVHKLRYLLRFRGKRRSKEERLSRQFCTETKFHIQKKRYGIEDNSCLQIVRKSSWKNLHVSTLPQRGCNGGARNAFLFGITHETTRGKAFTLPHRGENGPSLSTIHMSTSRVSSLQNVWHVLSFSRGQTFLQPSKRSPPTTGNN